jgi:hypothetical protein
MCRIERLQIQKMVMCHLKINKACNLEENHLERLDSMNTGEFRVGIQNLEFSL